MRRLHTELTFDPCVNVTALPDTCRPDTLVYPGGDVDTHMLELMQPWERRAFYIDGMHGALDRTENRKINYVGEAFANAHRHDRREAYRRTSNDFRPCADKQCFRPLTLLLKQRLEHSPVFDHVHSPRNLTLTFRLKGIPRALYYYVGSYSDFVEFGNWHRFLDGRVSTVALLGSSRIDASDLIRQFLDKAMPACLGLGTIIAMPESEADVARVYPIVSKRPIAYPLGDTLAGRRLSLEDRSSRHEQEEDGGQLVGGGAMAYCVALPGRNPGRYDATRQA